LNISSKKFHRFPKRLLWVLFISLLTISVIKKPRKVFIIGDSISIHYGPYLQHFLGDQYQYERKGGVHSQMNKPDIPEGANGGDSKRVVAYLDSLYHTSQFQTDYLVVNCGLHDIKILSSNGETSVSPEEYVQNLSEMIRLSKAMSTRLIWIRSTPVVDSIHNTKVHFKRFNKDVMRYNHLADSVMNAAQVPIIDLYSFTLKFGNDNYEDHVHFKKHIRIKQARYIAREIKKITKKY
jgi:lysophospholipase L1-like esterase